MRAGAWRGVPRVPAMELRPKGRRHSIVRDKRAVTHHYNLSNEYFALFLDESMTVLVRALVARRARRSRRRSATSSSWSARSSPCRPGERVLDVGCGWGSFAIHAAREHGVHVTGITLSEPQASLARERAAAAGVADRVDIRVMDYRELAGETFDAIASIGMVEHVGSVNIDAYFAKLASLLRPGGRLLNHGIARLRVGDAEAGPFSERYVFPDAAPLHLSRIQTARRARGPAHPPRRGLPGRLRAHAARVAAPLRGEHRPARASSAGDERVRVWRIYLRVSRQGFESGFMSVYQVRAVKPRPWPYA